MILLPERCFFMKNKEAVDAAVIYVGNSCSGTAIGIPFMPENPQLAQAYIPYQVYMGILPAMEGLHKGTVFPELYRPYHMK
jgi:hypothetical protein